MSLNTEYDSQDLQLVHMIDYLCAQDDGHNFGWDDVGREQIEAWNAPVREAGLDPRKHKVFHHANKEYLSPPAPFVRDGRDLGESGTTVVYRVRAPRGNDYAYPLALKVITCREMQGSPVGPDSETRHRALEEVRNMATIRHPHIVVYVASFEDYCIESRRVKLRQGRGKDLVVKYVHRERIQKHIIGIAMYPPAEHNLKTFMQDMFAPLPSDEERVKMGIYNDWKLACLVRHFGCLAQAVAYLHRSGIQIRHKDIKPENIIVDVWGAPLLTDFGLSTHFQKGMHSEGPTGKTAKYADPEATHELARDTRSDVFSLGCVFLEVATALLGQPPMFAEQNLRHGVASGSPMQEEFKYAESLARLDGYLALLATLRPPENPEWDRDPEHRESCRQPVVSILPHIASMMHERLDERPFADELYPHFRSMYSVFRSPGECPTCEAQYMTLQNGSPTHTAVATVLQRRGTGSEFSVSPPTIAKSSRPPTRRSTGDSIHSKRRSTVGSGPGRNTCANESGAGGWDGYGPIKPVLERGFSFGAEGRR